VACEDVARNCRRLFGRTKCFTHLDLSLLEPRFQPVELGDIYPAYAQDLGFGFIIALVSCWFGYTAKRRFCWCRRAATNSVVTSSLLIMLAGVILVNAILFLFPATAI
jgi:ABC-type transporter Mla maintaining outer membrane lipid asymmetry permease subunit MlaE